MDNFGDDLPLAENLIDSKAIRANTQYDIILQVKPEKIAQIIYGQKCIVIPIDEDEQTTVNGLDNLI